MRMATRAAVPMRGRDGGDAVDLAERFGVDRADAEADRARSSSVASLARRR